MTMENESKELYADLILDEMIDDVLHKISQCKQILVSLNTRSDDYTSFEEKLELIGDFDRWVRWPDSTVFQLKRAPDYGELVKMLLVALEYNLRMIVQAERKSSPGVPILWSSSKLTLKTLQEISKHLNIA
ncbi:hypothetical protein GGI35DRAFT_489860 [Trichoderma velutinum]